MKTGFRQHGEARASFFRPFVGTGRFGIELTPLGRAEAQSLVGGHRLWEAYLSKHFHLADDHLHAPAERMEHYISGEMRDALREDLTSPTHDPHGRPIPQTPDQSEPS